MKQRRSLSEHQGNASKLHRSVGSALESSALSRYKIYQEYPVSRINPDCTNNRLKFDWVILDLEVVIECHGRQHYEAVDYGGKSEDGGLIAFQETQSRDYTKKTFAEDAGFKYVVVKYDEGAITGEELTARILSAPSTAVPKPQKPEPSDDQLEQREKARQIRREKYKRDKEFARKLKEAAHGSQSE